MTTAHATRQRSAARLLVLSALAVLVGLLAFFPARALANGPPPGLVPPRQRGEVSVGYPEELLARPEPPGGTVRVKFVVGVDGVPRELEVERTVDPQLDAVVVNAVRQLRYDPATYEGQPVEVQLAVEVQLRPPAGESAAPPEGSPDQAAADADAPPPAPAATLTGAVLEAARRTPVVAASVTVLPVAAQTRPGRVRAGATAIPVAGSAAAEAAVSTIADADGRFDLSLPEPLASAERVRVIVQADGYVQAEWIETPETGGVLDVRYFLEPDQRERFKTVVVEDAAREEVGRKSLSIEEVNALPGNSGDALKSLQTMPGVARPPLGAGLLVIRGAAPFNSAVYLAGHGLPLAFHFGALATAVNSDVLEGVTFVPSNYDARWGNAIGGVVSLEPRAGRRDGVHGYVDADLFDAGALLEGPVGRGSYLVSLRRSYIDAVLGAVTPDDALSFTRAPRYWDYSAFLDHPLGEGTLSVRVLGGDDQLRFVSQAPNDAQTDSRNQTGAAAFVHRADLAYEVRRGPWRFDITPSFRWESADGVNGRSFDFGVQRQAFTTRAALSRELSSWASLEVGTENLLLWYQIDARSDPFDGSAVPGGESLFAPTSGALDQQVVQRSSDFSSTLALYTSATLGRGTPFRVIPAVRLNHWGFPMYTARVDPRLRFAWDVGTTTQLRGGVGRFTQTPVFQDLTESFGNPDLVPLDALHTSLEVEQQLPARTTLTVSGFFNALRDLPAPSQAFTVNADGTSTPTRLASTGEGRVYGLEFLLKKDLSRALVGWISYTLMRSERRDTARSPWYAYDYDQTHILTAVAAVLLPRHWRLGARFRLASGNPTTPVVGAYFNAQSGTYTPLQGARNGDRLPLFHQLDLRVDRSFYWRYISLNIYLDLQNAYDRSNVELYSYAFDYRSRADVNGLPIVPSLGLKLSF